ncbi:MAG: DUF1802 family protein [Bdellovibrionaceae bacterium]|nr:DUF1802 family protein [Pseudobdellovibrionaceae bacterium]
MLKVGYKEWSGVCEALGAGAQTLLLRKGGIAEGKSGFAFRHPRFYLLPTLFHQQAGLLRWESGGEKERDEAGCWLVRYEVELLQEAELRHWEEVEALSPYHVWQESVVRERFLDKGVPSIRAALVRVRKLERTWPWEEGSDLSGCRSWVEREWREGEAAPASEPVMAEEKFQALRETVASLWQSKQ